MTTPTTTSCSAFTRSEALRMGAARAGDGLPAIEPGMPTPAGTGLTRRGVLLRGAGMALSVYGASKLGVDALQEGVAEAASTPQTRVLVSIYMPGGIDGMSVLAPTGDPRYATLRPTLKVTTGTRHSVDPGLTWAPAAAGLATLDAERKIAAAPAIGYTGADQSHFTSRHFWETGDVGFSSAYGWLGRYLDRHGADGNPLQGLSLSGSLSPTLAPATVPVAAVADPFALGLWTPGMWGDALPPFYDALADLGALPTPDPQLRTARVAQGQAEQVRRQLGGLDGAAPSTSAYPAGDYGRRLAGLAKMIDDDLPLRCVTVDAPGGYDTHDNQATALPGLLKQTCDGILAFQRDLEARGVADRVVVLVWSEFGRRPKQNETGTDHGAAGVGFVIGTSVKPGLLGEFPGLATLDATDNLRSTLDFRSVYCGILEQWFGVDAGPLVPGASGFARPALLA
ncbi:DUF1501 domain-containing protein [Patulibacter minatonensis]|uniref:DUF1501 domain-containing protein n=1 Tax=Patulibacter minatonensis TaxID=298163 RepID=UPI000478B0C9|nr:DUF1501 domain-containing protein [Patulibacter minatonensis]